MVGWAGPGGGVRDSCGVAGGQEATTSVKNEEVVVSFGRASSRGSGKVRVKICNAPGKTLQAEVVDCCEGVSFDSARPPTSHTTTALPPPPLLQACSPSSRERRPERVRPRVLSTSFENILDVRNRDVSNPPQSFCGVASQNRPGRPPPPPPAAGFPPRAPPPPPFGGGHVSSIGRVFLSVPFRTLRTPGVPFPAVGRSGVARRARACVRAGGGCERKRMWGVSTARGSDYAGGGEGDEGWGGSWRRMRGGGGHEGRR